MTVGERRRVETPAGLPFGLDRERHRESADIASKNFAAKISERSNMLRERGSE
jgi:hypothetical protein